VKAQDAELAAWLKTNPAFVLGVTGSRGWTRRSSVWVPLTRMLRHHRRLIVRNGKARRGADRHVSDWAERFPDHLVLEDPHPADWGRHGNQAGFLRNQEMVDAGMDALMAWALPCEKKAPWCPPGEHPTHGTFDCVEKARAAGIPIHFSPEGMSW
jgi:hypothetical protein